MSGPLTYASLLFQRASQKSILLTDQLTILIVPFSTLALWMLGHRMTATIQETLALGVAITVIFVVGLRLAAASYLVWRDDQARKADLTAKLNQPKREAEASLRAYTNDRRKLLSEKLGRLTALANYKSAALSEIGIKADEVSALVLEVDAITSQLSYDVPLRIASVRLRNYFVNLLSDKANDRERLWQQRKLTFSLLHREDRISDLMTMIDIQMLDDEDDTEQTDELNELKAQIRKLGDEYYNPDFAKYLKDASEKHELSKNG